MNTAKYNQFKVAEDNLHTALMQVAALIKEEANTAGQTGSFHIHAKAEGAITASSFKIKYSVDPGGMTLAVTGNTLYAVVEEAFRRAGWEGLHQPVLITHQGAALIEDAGNNEDDGEEHPF